jgi:16S rRNA (cytosine967-C5)-methyltransferase
MAVSPARIIAFDILRRVAAQDSFADELLRSELDESVRAEDAALATELTLGVLRWQRLLDFLIARHLTRSPKKLDAEVQIALRLGAYQLWFLDRVPARAAVHESVDLVKRARKRSAAPFVNAVLRKAATEAGSLARSRNTFESFLPKDLSSIERLGILYSHPDWLVQRWLHNFGEERTRALLEADNSVPAVSFSLLDDRFQDEAIASLRLAGCSIEPGRLLQTATRLHGGNPAASEAVRCGRVVIQDEASQAVAQLLGVAPGNKVLDLCAAPGGKTLLLAQAAGSAGRVVATDVHEHRVRAMAARLERAGLRNTECLRLDGTEPLPFESSFDRILVDAPCSGTGTLARNPEIRWRLRPEDLPDLRARQVALLRNALAHLAPEGLLVYSTCSLEPEENELVVEDAIGEARGGFRLVSPRGAMVPLLRDTVSPESVIFPDGFFRTCPPDYGTDGFFAAVIERSSGKTGPDTGTSR